MKKIGFILLCAVVLLAFAACDTLAGTETPEEHIAGLGYSVYAGPLAGGEWETFAFTNSDNSDRVYYFPNNKSRNPSGTPYRQSACDWPYVFDVGTLSGSIAGDADFAPGVFTLNADKTTLTFSNYMGQGSALSLALTRKADGTDVENPFSVNPLSASDSLDQTVWAGTAYRTKDWTTLTVTVTDYMLARGTIDVSHSFDCTSNPRNYSGYVYNTTTTLEYIGDFKIAGDSFTFDNFYGHGGEITLKRMR